MGQGYSFLLALHPIPAMFTLFPTIFSTCHVFGDKNTNKNNITHQQVKSGVSVFLVCLRIQKHSIPFKTSISIRPSPSFRFYLYPACSLPSSLPYQAKPSQAKPKPPPRIYTLFLFAPSPRSRSSSSSSLSAVSAGLSKECTLLAILLLLVAGALL